MERSAKPHEEKYGTLASKLAVFMVAEQIEKALCGVAPARTFQGW